MEKKLNFQLFWFQKFFFTLRHLILMSSTHFLILLYKKGKKEKNSVFDSNLGTLICTVEN